MKCLAKLSEESKQKKGYDYTITQKSSFLSGVMKEALQSWHARKKKKALSNICPLREKEEVWLHHWEEHFSGLSHFKDQQTPWVWGKGFPCRES